MLRRKRFKMALAVVAVTACIFVYAGVDLRSSRHERQSPGRRLHIVRITNEDISKLGGGAQPPELPPSLLYPRASPSVTVIPPPSPLRAVPFQTLPRQPDARSDGNLLYDASDVSYRSSSHFADTSRLNKTSSVSGTRQVSQSHDLRAPVDSVRQNSISGENRSVIKPKKEEAAADDAQKDDDDVYTIEKEVIAMANLGPIPKDKRKKLEMYLSHLSSDQFREVYRNIIGYDNEDNEIDIFSHPKNRVVDGSEISAPLHLMLPGRAFGLTNGTHSQAHRRCTYGCAEHKSPGGILRGYSARVKIESLTLPPDWTSTPEVEERLQQRQQHLKDVCHKYDLDVPSPNNSINAWEFFISDKFKLVWCSVFKAASSTWIYNFNILAGYSENFLLKAKDTPITLARKKYPRPSVSELTQFMNRSEKPLSFLITRHPLHRLVSAYRDKLLSGHRYYSKLARKVVAAYPHLGQGKQTREEGRLENAPLLNSRARLARKIVVPTFPQLVQYLIDSHRRGEPFDEHWAPINQFCTPCLFQFDVIAKLETIDEDSNYVIFKSGIENYIRPKRINRNRNAPTDEVAHSFLCQLSTDMMRSLINIYKMDLELFDYRYDQYLNCTTDEVRLERVGKVR